MNQVENVRQCSKWILLASHLARMESPLKEMEFEAFQRRVSELACWNFEPRPDQPEKYDQQTAFFESRTPGPCFLLGGNGAGTTTLGIAKAVDFMTTQQPPPRRDSPFWIIAKNYEQVCNVAWKEKLHQQGHVDPNIVDWDRIQWYRPNQDYPFKVPLKPWPGRPGKNYQICFKSYEQGRGAMMGESICGFLFIEQFPWGLLEEVLRGCREYDFVGNKLCEFTPVDPSLSIELRNMEVKGEIPEGWGLYRASTRCAMEAGHVTKQWYDQFMSMVPESMRPMRECGLWAAFEGAVYPEWNPAIHCVKSDFVIPPAWHHRRAVDFGFTVGHPFVCLWAAFDDAGRCVIYDEYWSNDTSKSVIDHWREIDERHYWPQQSPYYGTTWCDHDIDCIRILGRIGDYTNGDIDPPQIDLARKSVAEGIEHVKYMLKPSMQIEPGKFEPRLKVIDSHCPHLCEEFITYHYAKKMTDGVNTNAVRNEPVKINDDSVDCLRYVLFSEAMMKNITPSTMAHLHSAGSTQIQSEKFKRNRVTKPPRSINNDRD